MVAIPRTVVVVGVAVVAALVATLPKLATAAPAARLGAAREVGEVLKVTLPPAQDFNVTMGHLACDAAAARLRTYAAALGSATCEDGADQAARLTAVRTALAALAAASDTMGCTLSAPAHAAVAAALGIADPQRACGVHPPPPVVVPRIVPMPGTSALTVVLEDLRTPPPPRCCTGTAQFQLACCTDTCAYMIILLPGWFTLAECCKSPFNSQPPSPFCPMP